MCPLFKMPRYLQGPRRYLGKQRKNYKWDQDNLKNSLQCHSNLKIKFKVNQLLRSWATKQHSELQEHNAGVNMSGLLGKDVSDGHAEVCKSWNRHFTTCALSPHKRINQRGECHNLHAQTHLLVILLLQYTERRVSQSHLSDVGWSKWVKKQYEETGRTFLNNACLIL